MPITPATCVAEGPHAGTGERGDVDDRVGALLGRQHQGVGHDQAALGVGVDDLDGRAAANGDHVAELAIAVPDGMLSVHMR